MEHHTKNC